MAKVKHTVTEWLQKVKVMDKSLPKKVKDLKGNLYVPYMEYEGEPNKSEDIIGKFKSVEAMTENLARIKDALMVYNATTKINISGREYSIAFCLGNRFKTGIGELLITTYNDKACFLSEKKRESMDKIEEVESDFRKKANPSQKDREDLDTARKRYEVKVFDPLDLDAKVKAYQDYLDAVQTEVNTKINIKNATTELEIDLVD